MPLTVPHHCIGFRKVVTPVGTQLAAIMLLSTTCNGYRNALYAHMSQLKCTAGQAVNQGDVIGLVGSTGDSTGNHCHFEMY